MRFEFAEHHLQLLSDLRSFSRLKRYHGMLPVRHVMQNDDVVRELLDAGLVERLHLSLKCGSELQMLKLTDHGVAAIEDLSARSALPYADAAEYDPETEDDYERLDRATTMLLNDIFHYSKIHKHDGITPLDMLESYDKDNLNTLFRNGYLVRVKAEMGSGKKRKGAILSSKGLRYLRALDLI